MTREKQSKNMLSALKENSFVVWCRLVLENLTESFQLAKCLRSSNESKDPNKKQADLQIRAHALEKGMSIGKVKKDFGKPKAIALISDLDRFLTTGGNRDFATDVVSIIKKYIQYNKGQGSDMCEIEERLGAVMNSHNLKAQDRGGIRTINFNETREKITSSFDVFSQSRYSIRDFGQEPLDMDNVLAALKLCERTPSACNRQSWRVHVYNDTDLRNRIFDLQRGCNGFSRDMQCAILICVDIRCYGFYEKNLPFVDGGIYAMNLLYALHSRHLAAIPLTMGLKAEQINTLKKEMKIPKHEIPVLLIGVGTFKENFKVAISERHDFHNYVSINNKTE